MDFNNATFLAHSKKSQFFSDTIRYRTDEDISIKGYLLNLKNTDGASGILTGLSAFETVNNNDWQNIVINGISFGSGFIKNFGFSEGRDVQTKEYTVTISIPQSGDFSSLLGQDYTGLNYNYYQYIDGFSETSNVDMGILKQNYSQNVKFNLKGPYSLSGVTAAQTLATNLFKNNNLNNVLGAFYNNDSSGNAIKKFYTESYDSINNTFDFSRTFEVNKNSTGDYSVYRSHSITFDNDGIGKINEKAEYLGHTASPFNTVAAQSRIDLNNAYSRCSAIFSNYLPTATNATLLTQPISKVIASIPYKGVLNYDIVFSNALRIQSNSFWDYAINVDKTQAEKYIISEQGSIVGFGHINYNKYNNAITSWDSIRPLIFDRVDVYYPDTQTLRLMSTSTTYNQVQGKIDYSYKYTDSDTVLATQDIRKAMVSITSEYNRNLNSTFGIINYKEIIQVQKNLVPNQINYSVKLNGKADTSISTYLTRANSYVTPQYGGQSSNQYISDCNYNYNPYDRSFSLLVTSVVLP